MTTKKKSESSLEMAVNKVLSKVTGLWVSHLETNIPGFPDTIVVGNRSMFIEYKIASSDSVLNRVYEPAQLKVHHEISKAGATVVTATFNREVPGLITVYQSGLMFEKLLEPGPTYRFRDFKCTEFSSAVKFAEWVRSFCA